MIYAIDTSGSMTAKDLDTIVTFVRGQSDASKVVLFDTDILKELQPSDLSTSDLPGMGGTLVQPVFDWMLANAPTEPLTIISDGYFATDFNSHGVNTTCLIIGNSDNDHWAKLMSNDNVFSKVVPLIDA